jgi:FHS family glucose/mannose:H+ symporter-like MFS transporter
MSGSTSSRLSSRLVGLLYLNFVLTGTATTLLGPLIPLLVKRCLMSDAGVGWLVAAQFAGQFAGALFANRNLRRSLLAGMPLISLGVGALAFSSCSLSYFCAACYGVGLGLDISAVNLIIASQQSELRAYSLTLLNFLWGVGAVASPVLVAWAQHYQLLSWSLLGLGVAFFALWLIMIRSDISLPPQHETGSAGTWYSRPLLFFGTLFFLYVGVETSVGAWTALYATRMPHGNESIAASAVGCFWLALLSGRLINAALLRRIPELPLYTLSLAIMLGGLSLFLFSRSSMQVVLAASVTGLGLAPLFPLIMSFASDSLLARRNSGWVFSSAGLGGAILPWLTGQVSTQFGSLRAGFILPASAAVVIVVLSLAGWEECLKRARCSHLLLLKI